jgi:hypothetical protein
MSRLEKLEIVKLKYHLFYIHDSNQIYMVVSVNPIASIHVLIRRVVLCS